ncbi:MAG: Asp-tRNA(Asn)/Glu-tRNA(Gln) amidotransferase subunit GatB [Cyclobacteriaceae bacterium]|nr:Asp-tRNA(Asn)/Glu-tRNA(Gln) amidotransferase subunit GatB [Cyclobacteriaceae bacterium]
MSAFAFVNYTPVIGLEVHIQLATTSKLFAGDSTTYGAEPNTQVSAITLAHPGTLPKLNKKAVEYAVKMGLACESEISREFYFDRKNYFYPDLPKGYQITQHRTPVCKGGIVPVRMPDGIVRAVRLNRIHLEEDAGKSIHESEHTETLLDFNRAGVALLELVTEPVIRSAEEAGAFLSEIRKLVRYLGISDGNMEEGSLRCDANVSVMPEGSTRFGQKVEIKNLNSIRFVQQAISAEIERQITMLNAGLRIKSETRLYDPVSGNTAAMRTKEELNDYRYFPEPDLSPVVISEDWLATIRLAMPELPWQRVEKFVAHYGLPLYDALVLTEARELADYFETVCRFTSNYKAVSNWIMGPVKSYCNDNPGNGFPLTANLLAELVGLVETNQVSFSVASQKIFPELIKNPSKTALQVAQQLNVLQESNAGVILPVIKSVLNDYPQKVNEYKKGKKGIIAMFMGEVMKRTQGKADPKLATELIRKQLENQ